MRFDLMNSEVWDDLNESVRLRLSLPEKATVRCYQGLAHAVFEVCEGASNFFSHKRSLGVIKGQTPVFNSLLPGFYKDGYQVQAQAVWPKGTEKTWVEALKKDTNFVLYSSDNPITAEVFDWEVLDLALNEKKIFSLRVSHVDWLRDFKAGKKAVQPYATHFLSINPGLALAVSGEKVKTNSVVAGQMPWPTKLIEEQIDLTIKSFSENQKAVTEFEANLPTGWTSLFKRLHGDPAAPRVYDRALIFNTEAHGEAVIEALAELSQLAISLPGNAAVFETTNLARWNSILSFFDWWSAQLSPEEIRGLISVDAKALSDPGKFKDSLSQAMKKISL